jgi:hypothetical protein
METEMIDEKDAEAPTIAHGIPVLMRTGLAEERIVELQTGVGVTAILAIVAAERGCLVEELVLVRESEDEPLTEVIRIEVDYPHHRRHHVHYAGLVEVTVYYQAGSHRRSFKRHKTVDDVLAWAVEAFDLDPSMATEFELALHGQTAELSPSEHIGHVAGRHCEVALDLVRGHISNGDRHAR